jgi:RNA polymerase-binding transcription factor DksA
MNNDVYIRKKAKGIDKIQKTHYPVCPSCGNSDYNRLIFCTLCNVLVCDICNTDHENNRDENKKK